MQQGSMHTLRHSFATGKPQTNQFNRLFLDKKRVEGHCFTGHIQKKRLASESVEEKQAIAVFPSCNQRLNDKAHLGKQQIAGT